MNFTNREPTDWKDLQNLVAKYFNEAGYSAITPYEIETVRGKVEVDVFVQAEMELSKVILCECKLWKTKITKEKVHAFRTVVSDSGASLGIIISKIGFQKGAIQAAENSNIELKTWEEFLSMIYDRWLTSRIIYLKRKVAPLGVYMDPMDMPCEKLSSEDKNKYFELIEKYSKVQSIVWMLSKEHFLQDMRRFPVYKSVCLDVPELFINFLAYQAEEALKSFRKVFAGIDIPKYKFDLPDAYALMNL